MKTNIYKKGITLLAILLLLIITIIGYEITKKEDFSNKEVNKVLDFELEDKNNDKTDNGNKKINELTNKSCKKIKVEIAGEIINPGVYELNSDKRVDDLINVAGGLSNEADKEFISKYINRSAKLSDEDKVYIPSKQEVKENKINCKEIIIHNNIVDNNNNNSKININTASLQELMTLEGIGEIYAKRIIEYRNNSKFSSIEEIKNVKGIGESRYKSIKNKIIVE